MSIQRVETESGPAFRSSTCKDDFSNMSTVTVAGQRIHMQACAVRAFREACKLFAKRSGWSESRIRRTGGRPILLTGSWRTCALQEHLHASDPSRFASAEGSLHPQGLAIDVSTVMPDFELAHKCLAAVGWRRARSDEPWHHSWGFTA